MRVQAFGAPRGPHSHAGAEKPKLRPLYRTLVARQKQIEQLRGEGNRVPLRLIDNPFHRRYYASQGWAQ